MANDKKFIVKNGLQSENNVLVGTTTDDGVNKLQVSGTTKLINSGSSVPITIENTGGINTPLINFEGGVGALQVKNTGSGDYSILNTSGANEIKFNDNTANGLVFIAGNTDQLKINTTVADFTNVPSINGVPVWYSGNDGAGSGLDADLLDGLNSIQFLRSDENDTFDGDLVITGDLTVQGTRTEIISETVLIADNIITLNSNFTASNPTENAGIEVERGTLTNSIFQWNETMDWWELNSAGTSLGRIITTADEGSGNGFDADTVDGLQASQFIRSDVNDVATGNLEFEGTVAIGNEAGSALLTMRGAGTNRVLSSDNGKIGFLDTGFAYNTYSDANYNWHVGNDVIAKRLLDADDNSYLVDPAGESQLNDVVLVGELYGHDGTAKDGSTYIDLQNNGTTGLIYFNVDGAGLHTTLSKDQMFVNKKVVAPRFEDSNDNGYYVVPSSVSRLSQIQIDDYIIHKGDTNTYFGFDTDDSYKLYINGVQQLAMSASSAVFTNDVEAARFVDSDNNSYFLDPASASTLNTIGIDSDLFHNGDTDTKLSFGTNQIDFNTGGTQRLSIANAASTFSHSVIAPNVYIDDYIYHTGDTPANTTYFGFSADDNFGVVLGGNGALLLTPTATTSIAYIYAPRFVDTDNSARYLDPSATSPLNNISLDGVLQNLNDPDTYLTFASDAVQFYTGNTLRAFINNSYLETTVSVRSPVYYGTSQIVDFLDLDAGAGSDALRVRGRLNIGGGTDVERFNDTTGNGGITISGYAGMGGTTNPSIQVSGANGARSLLSLNKIDIGGNPYSSKNNYFAEFLTDGAAAFSIRGDNSKNAYFIADADQKMVFMDSGANTRLAMDELGNTIIGNDSISFTQGSHTPVLASGAKTDGKLHVDGSIHINGADDALVIGGTTSTFLRDDELGFGSGGGFYMNDTTNLRVRNNKLLTSTGNASFAQYLDANDVLFYGDFASTSRMNNISLVGEIIHDGDTNTKIGFGADQIIFTAGGTAQLDVYTTYAEAATDMRSPIFSDAGGTFKFEPNTSSAHRFTTPTGWLEIGSKVAGSTAFDTDRALFTFNKRVNFDGGISAADTNDDAYFNRYYDYGDNNYYIDAAGDSQLNTIDIDDFIRHRGDTGTYMGFSAAATYKVVIVGTERLNIDGNSADFNVDVYAPRYYDSNNTNYYVDPGSTSIVNNLRTNQIQMDGSSLIIDSPSGPKGTIMVTGERDSYAGYMIDNDWGFISSGATEMGLYNETDNEWSLLANRNNFTRLYSNNVHQIGAENGYGYAPNRMRAPIFEDSNDTAFYADLAGQSRLKSVKAGDSAIYNNTTYPLEVKSSQERMIVMQNTSADTNFPSILHNTRNSRATMALSFNNIGERFWFEENGNIQAYGAGIFGSLALNGGNEDLGLLKTYGSGLADLKMFDASDYWDKRVIQPMQGSENSATSSTGEYVKNGNGPFASSYALRTAGYRDFDSDYIPVQPGETIYVEQAVRNISGSGGLFYLGVRRYDKDKNPIASNDGIVYFGASAINNTSTSWTEYKGTHTLPTSHTPYNGSDGEGVRYVRVISLMNYSAGGATREFGPPILKRTNVQSDLVTPNLTVEVDLTVGGNATITGDLTVDDITADVITANRFADRGNTAYYVEPLTGAKVAGSWDWTNGSINNLNNLTFNDPGPNEGIKWNGGNLWQIYESPNDLATNTGGNLQFTSGANQGSMRLRVDTSGDVYAGRYHRAQRFYDTNNAAYYADPASTSVLNQVYINEYLRHSGDTDTYLRFIGADDMQLVAGGRQMLRMGEGTDPDRLRFVTDSNWTDSNGDWAMSRNVVVQGTHTAVNSSYAPIFYDYDDNAYYGNFAGTSLMNIVRANRFEVDGSTRYIDGISGQYGTIRVTGNTNGYAGYAINDDWVFMSSGAGMSGIYNDTNNEWSAQFLQNSDVKLYHNGGEKFSTNSGGATIYGRLIADYMADRNNTAYTVNPAGTSRFLDLDVDNPIGGNIAGYSENLLRVDNRDIEPNDHTAGRLTFGFTSWNNNNTSPWADYLHLRSYTDASGGSDNLLMFKKSGRGMRLWQQTFNSGTAYSAYSDVAIYNANPGNTPFYASRYYDSNNTAYYGDFASTSIVNIIRYASGGYAEFQTAAGNIRGYMQATDDNDAHLKIATSGGEDIRFTDGGLSGDWNVIIRGDGQTLIRSRLDTPIMYDRDDTGYYSNPAGASNFNTSIRANEVYARNWFRNDNSGEGMYNQATGMHWYSTNNTTWRAYGGQTTVKIEMNTASNTLRGSFYANNSDEVGILSQDNGWALQATNSKVDAHHNFYAPIFYDRDDSNYYVNPAGDARISGTVQANRFTHRDAVSQNDTFGLYFADNASTAYAIYRESGGWSSPYPDLRIAFHTGIKFGANSGYQGMRFYNDYNMVTQVMSINNGSDPLGANDVYVNNSLQSGNSLRSPIFYDSNDTARYTNPASTSEMGTIRADRFDMRDRGDWITFYGDDSTNHGIASRGSTGTATDDIRINTYGSLFINLDSNNNNTSGADFYIGRHGSATGTIANSDLFRVYGDDNYAYSAYSFRAPIFYDSNDTGYYCNPNSSSNFATSVRANEFYARNWFRNDNGAEGLYNQNNGCHFYARSSQYWHATGNNNASAINMQLRSTYDGNIRMWLHGDSSSWCGYLNDGGQWMIRTRMTDGSSPNHWYYEDSNTTWTGNPGNDKGKIEYHSDRFYIAAGGNSNRICQFRRDGTDKAYVNNDGVYVGTATSAQWADLAERYSADEVYENGTLLGMNLDGESEGTLYQPGMPILGVISTSPGVKMNDMEIEDDNSLEGKMNPYIALKGRIPCKVNGDVKKGQWLIPDIDGKCKGIDYGTSGINSHEIIGIALSDSENGEVEVKV